MRTPQRLLAAHALPHARRREGDVIWKLPTLEGTDIYLYLLFEFQSRIDYWMAVRAQIYQGLLWQQVIDEQKLETGARLPPLLLLVLYNGLLRWTAPTQVRNLIALSRDSALWSWQPQVRYYLLDMGAVPGDELVRRRSLAALLFRLQRPLAPDEPEGLLKEVIGWFRHHPDQERLRHLFAELVCQALQGLAVKAPLSNDLLETNMNSNFPEMLKTWHLQGVAEGRAEGKAEGKTEGKAEALVSLLAARFGTLAPSLRTRIHRANLTALERWFKRALVAPDLRSVFGGGSSPSER